MPAISIPAAIGLAQTAGFSGAALVTVVAIAMAESGLDPAAAGTNTDGSVDRGILQINSRWHPEVTDACAYDAACAFGAGLTISKHGSDFSPWTTYTGGAYQQYVAQVQADLPSVVTLDSRVAALESFVAALKGAVCG